LLGLPKNFYEDNNGDSFDVDISRISKNYELNEIQQE
jgi:hypothetical protein